MSNKDTKLKAIALREIRLTKPTEGGELRAKAALSQLSASVGVDLHKQADLLHVEAVLVSEGINDNDDAFTREGLKRALSSPILKPINWQHKDDKILGAMYAVEARDFNGNIVEEIGDEPVELIIQGVVWHYLPHIKATAEQIVKRINDNDLFVSMECWFDSYDYGIYTEAGELYDLVERNDQTAFLDGYLRANGGVGKYKGKRIGRALSGVNFGGVAFVDRPANKRSFILNQFAFDPNDIFDGVNAQEDGLDQDQVVTNNVVSDENPTLEVNMNDVNRSAASADGLNQQAVQAAVQKALAEQKGKEQAERMVAELSDTKQALASTKDELAEAQSRLENLQNAIEAAFEEAKAGATASTPEEIAKIDRAIQQKGAGAGDAVFAARIAWIADSLNKAAASADDSELAKANEKLAEENALLTRELATLKAEARKAELEYLFNDVLELAEDEVKMFVEAGLKFEDDEAYANWLDEKKLFAKKMLDMKKKMEKEDDKGKKDSEAGLLDPSDRETPIDDHGAVLRPRNGRVPTSMSDRPRSKLTAAASDLDAMFEEVNEPNLAGASSDEGNGPNPMGRLVAGLLDDNKKNQDN